MLDVDPLLIPEKLLDPRVLDADAPFDPAVTLEPWVLDMDTLLKLPVFLGSLEAVCSCSRCSPCSLYI